MVLGRITRKLAIQTKFGASPPHRHKKFKQLVPCATRLV